MRRNPIYYLALSAILLMNAPMVRAQGGGTDQKTMGTAAAPKSGYRAEFLEEIAYYEQRYTRLAEAMPADKYNWRPAEGVRSVGEVFTHITAANYGIAKAYGMATPPGYDAKATTDASGDKAKVIEGLKESFAHFRSAISALGEGDADKPQKMFNRSTTLRGSFIAITGHFGEHLGQSIAYARMNGVVPPWTEGFQQAQPKSGEKPKP